MRFLNGNLMARKIIFELKARPLLARLRYPFLITYGQQVLCLVLCFFPRHCFLYIFINIGKILVCFAMINFFGVIEKHSFRKQWQWKKQGQGMNPITNRASKMSILFMLESMRVKSFPSPLCCNTCRKLHTVLNIDHVFKK